MKRIAEKLKISYNDVRYTLQHLNETGLGQDKKKGQEDSEELPQSKTNT